MQNANLLVQKKILFDQFLSEDGLCLLNEKEDSPPKDREKLNLRTAGNDNGILYLAYAYALFDYFKLIEIADYKRIEETIERLETQKYSGLFNRHPNAPLDDRIEGLDNYVGIVYLSTLFNLRFRKDILRHGMKTGFNYNNKFPYQFNVRAQRQPSDTAFYKISNDLNPSPIEWLWLWGGIIVNAFQSKKRTSEHLMTWLRLKTLDIMSTKSQRIPVFCFFIQTIVKAIWLFALKRKTGGIGGVISSFFQNQNHPNRILSNNLRY